MPFYERQPYISPLHQILAEVLRGEIRIPRFQRPGTEWTDEQRGDLLDSLYRGFPVGTILLWSTASPIRTKDVVGGYRIQPGPAGGSQRLLLDGHQRLSTLVQILGPGLPGVAPPTANDEAPAHGQWVFEVSADENMRKRTRDRFVLLKPGQSPGDTQLPLDLALNRVALNRWVRERTGSLTDEQVTEVDALRDRLREYNIPVAVLAVDALTDATESFKRINSSGTPMTDFNMVAALAYSDAEDPQEAFEQCRDELLAPIGWQGVSDMDVLRVCAALAGQHPAKLEVDGLAEKLATDAGLIRRAFQAVADAAVMIDRTCGIAGPGVLPYSWQLITLAVWLGREPRDVATGGVAESVRRWVWLTTYGEVFAGVNSAVYDRSLRALDDLAQGGTGAAMERDLTRRVRPVGGFDYRAARARAVILAMARHEDGPAGPGAAHRALVGGIEALGVLFAKAGRAKWWNRLILTPERTVNEVRNALRNRAAGNALPEQDDLLQALGIPSDARGTQEQLLDARRGLIEQEERQFIKELGLDWADGD